MAVAGSAVPSIQVFLHADGRLGTDAPMLRAGSVVEEDPEAALRRLQAGEPRVNLRLWADNLDVLRALAFTAAQRAAGAAVE